MGRRAAGMVVLVVLVIACGRGDAPGEEANTSRGPITVWYSNNPDELAWGQAMLDAWNAEHPDEQVTSQEIPRR